MVGNQPSESEFKMDQSILRIDMGFVNAYLLQAGEGYILVDTGIGDVWTKLESELL